MEIHRDTRRSLQLLDECADTLWRNKSRHILDGNHIRTESCQLLCLCHEIVIGKYRSRILLAHKLLEERELRIFRIYGVADCAVGNTAILLHIFDCRFYILDIVQAVEDTHNTKTTLNGVAAETLDNLVGIRCITKEVTTTREGCEFRHIANLLLDAFKAIPRVLAEVAHHRVRHCTTPYLHSIEVCIFVIRETSLQLRLRHTGSK